MAYSGSTRTFNLFEDMRLQVGTPNARSYVLGGAIISDGLGGDFYWNDASTADDDNENVIQGPVTTGRWIRVGVTP